MEYRKVEVYAEGEWYEVKFEDLKPEDTFRLWDSPDDPVVSPDGDTYWRCTSDPYMSECKQHDGTVQNVLTVTTEKIIDLE